ncbi:hypothetical protein SX4_3465 [Vibrio mimicus SX-4]|nr:hypothetical protein SX4_3465 [Vibrio mimicus SX-4]KFE29626.1 hypothetical protein DN31_3658 [Vibrio mimicus]
MGSIKMSNRRYDSVTPGVIKRWIGYASVCFDPEPIIGLAALHPDVG